MNKMDPPQIVVVAAAGSGAGASTSATSRAGDEISKAVRIIDPTSNVSLSR
jgi:hypothetical protein